MTDTGSGDEMNPFDNPHHFDDSVRFITELATAIARYNGHSYDADKVILRVIGALGLKGEILAVPGAMILALWQDDMHHQTIHLATSGQTIYDMARLERVMAILGDVEGGRISPADGLRRLKEIEHAPAIYGNLPKAIAYFLAGIGFGVILGISWLDVLIGGVLGLAAFGVELLASRSSRVETTPVLLLSVLIAFLAGVIGVVLPGIHPLAVTVCALTIYIPGFGLTIAPREINAGATLSGVVYFTDALFVSLKLLLGTILGLGLASSLFPLAVTEPLAGVDPHFIWVFIPLLLISNAILFGVSPNKFWLVIICGLLVWVGVTLGNTLGFWQGAFFGAIILALSARVAARRFGIPLSTVLLPVVLMLVPGYEFVRALYLLNGHEFMAGVSAGFQIFGIIIAIVGGVFVGDIIGSWRRITRKE